MLSGRMFLGRKQLFISSMFLFDTCVVYFRPCPVYNYLPDLKWYQARSQSVIVAGVGGGAFPPQKNCFVIKMCVSATSVSCFLSLEIIIVNKLISSLI